MRQPERRIEGDGQSLGGLAYLGAAGMGGGGQVAAERFGEGVEGMAPL